MIKTTLLIFCLTCLISLVSFSKPSTIYYNDVKKVSVFSLDTAITDAYLIELAQQDARVHFKNIGGNAIVWIVNIWLSPLLGWLAPVIMMYIPLKGKLKIANSTYANNDVYIKAYEKEWYKIRKTRLWTNFAISSVLYMSVLITLIYALINAFKGFSFW